MLDSDYSLVDHISCHCIGFQNIKYKELCNTAGANPYLCFSI